MKTRKVLEVNACGAKLVGYHEEGKPNPWRLYNVWWDRGEHRRMLAKYANFISLVQRVEQFYNDVPKAWAD